ncbi:MAG: hypothetical protein ACRDU0_07825, partial [Mycobacterium sp.]
PGGMSMTAARSVLPPMDLATILRDWERTLKAEHQSPAHHQVVPDRRPPARGLRGRPGSG